MTNPSETTNKPANKFPGTCACGTSVSAGAGFRSPRKVNGKWEITCRPCETGETPTPVSQDTPIAERPTFTLTDEQQAAVTLFLGGDTIAIQAGAGTGKTSTLIAMAKATSRFGQYVAFNRSIVDEAARKMPENVACATMSALAYRQVGKVHYAARLNSKQRVTSSKLAQRMGIRPFYFTEGTETRVLQPGKLASILFEGINNFCASADPEPTSRHLPYVDGIDTPNADGSRSYRVNDMVKHHLAPFITSTWADLASPTGTCPRFTLTHVEKIWQLGLHGAPVVPGAFILFDEAQDANPVYLDVIRQQGSQVVYVGDSQQQIYEWRGAVNALANVPADATAFLTNSFRFGPEIAGMANLVLDRIESAQIRIVGKGQPGTLNTSTEHDAILTRTNAGAISTVLRLIESGQRVHLTGKNDDLVRFVKGAEELITTGRTEHADLAPFTSWAQVQEYVSQDSDGADLKLMVQLIDNYGTGTILSALDGTVSAEDADVTVSTCHKAKGLEWDNVKLGSDFSDGRIADESELRLLYVAVTRAMKNLDFSTCPAMLAIAGETEGE